MTTMRSALDAGVKSISDKFLNSAKANQTSFDCLDESGWRDVYRNVGNFGSDITLNLSDPMGDGDQSPLLSRNEQSPMFNQNANFHRNLWSAGGDFNFQLAMGTLPPFVLACVIGSVEGCEELLRKCGSPEKQKEMVETRVSILRIPP